MRVPETGSETASQELAAPRFDLISCIDGATLKAAALPETLITLKNGGTAGWRFTPRAVGPAGPVHLGSLDWRDAEQLDFTVLSQITAQLAGANTQAALCLIPASFHTVSSQKGRTEMAARIGELAVQEKCRVVLELRDFRGVPKERLTEVIAQIRPACFSVIAEIQADRAELALIGSCGVSGVSIRTSGDWTSDPKAVASVSAVADLARGIAPVRIARAMDRSRLPVLAKAGFTHAAVPIRGA